jgi:hypothetical protein
MKERFGKNVFAIQRGELMNEVLKKNPKTSTEEIEEMNNYLDKLPSNFQNVLNLKKQNNKQQKAT